MRQICGVSLVAEAGIAVATDDRATSPRSRAMKKLRRALCMLDECLPVLVKVPHARRWRAEAL